MKYLVTVKLPKNPAHDPRNKVIGDCPVNGSPCTDVTGEHHTILVESELGIVGVREAWAETFHVTRVKVG